MVVVDTNAGPRLPTVPESPCASPLTAPYNETDSMRESIDLAKSLNLKPHTEEASSQLENAVSSHLCERAVVLEAEAMKCIARGEVREAVATFDLAVDMRGGTANMSSLHAFVVALHEQALLRSDTNESVEWLTLASRTLSTKGASAASKANT